MSDVRGQMSERASPAGQRSQVSGSAAVHVDQRPAVAPGASRLLRPLISRNTRNYLKSDDSCQSVQDKLGSEQKSRQRCGIRASRDPTRNRRKPVALTSDL